LGIITTSVVAMEDFKAMHETLEYSYNNGHPVDIHTETGVYEDCDVTSLSDHDATDGMVDFSAIHPIKDCQYDFRMYFKEIRKVVLV